MAPRRTHIAGHRSKRPAAVVESPADLNSTASTPPDASAVSPVPQPKQEAPDVRDDAQTGHGQWGRRLTVAGAFVTAIAAVVATIGSWHFSARALEQSTEQSRQTEKGQISERFSRSVEQIGADTVAARVGGVYSFARLMHDSPGDREAIVEILSGLVRTQAVRPARPRAGSVQVVPADIFAALKVMGNQQAADPRNKFWPMLLDGVDLSSFELSSVRLDGASLVEAKLPRANLRSLARAKLIGADLTGSHLVNANLTKTVLSRAHLKLARLDGADLSGANLSGANLTGASLVSAHLSGADLSGANLSGAKGLESSALATAVCSDKTIWPKGLSLPPSLRCTKTS